MLKAFFVLARIVTLALMSMPSQGGGLVFAYGPGNGAPFSIIKDGQLVSGMFKSLGDLLAQELKLTVDYVHAPTQRVSQLISSGEINSVCFTNADWIEASEQLWWSPVIARDEDHLISLTSADLNLSSPSHVHGLTVAAMVGYVYSLNFMGLIEQKKVRRQNVNKIDSLYSMLYAKRVDASVDSLFSYYYRVKTQQIHEPLTVSEVSVYQYDLHCAFSRQLSEHYPRLQITFKRLIERGDIQRLILRYR